MLVSPHFEGYPIYNPIGSMYGIYANIGGILMINVTIYSIHGSYGNCNLYNLEPPLLPITSTKCTPHVKKLGSVFNFGKFGVGQFDSQDPLLKAT